MTTARAPLFRDPIHDGAADPTIIWNRDEESWWILYTNRRANVDGRGVAWVHGTDIGVASSCDGGQSWLYRGVLSGLEFERGRNTFWAPEVLWADGLYQRIFSTSPVSVATTPPSATTPMCWCKVTVRSSFTLPTPSYIGRQMGRVQDSRIWCPMRRAAHRFRWPSSSCVTVG